MWGSTDRMASLRSINCLHRLGHAGVDRAKKCRQSTSLTGMWGLTFLIAWFASTLNARWEQTFGLHPVRGILFS